MTQQSANDILQHLHQQPTEPLQRGRQRSFSGGTLALDWIDQKRTPEEAGHGGNGRHQWSDDEGPYYHTHGHSELCCWQTFPGSARCPRHDRGRPLRLETGDRNTTCCRRSYTSNLLCAIHDHIAASHVDMASSQTTPSSGPAYSLTMEQHPPSPVKSTLFGTSLAQSFSSARSVRSIGPYGSQDYNELHIVLGYQGSRPSERRNSARSNASGNLLETPCARSSSSRPSLTSIDLHSSQQSTSHPTTIPLDPRFPECRNSNVFDSPEWGTGNTTASCLGISGGIPSAMIQSQILSQPVSCHDPVHVDTSSRGGSPPLDASRDDLRERFGSFGAQRSPPLVGEGELKAATVWEWLKGRSWEAEKGLVGEEWEREAASRGREAGEVGG